MKKTKILTILLIVSTITIIVMSIWIYNLYSDKNQKIKNLEVQINNLNDKINNLKDNTDILDESSIKIDSKVATEYLNIINKTMGDDPEIDIKGDLIYFNNDNIPDLLISNTDYWTSVYIYENGTAKNVIDKWTYGTSGNAGYSYLENKGIVLNYNTALAGAVITKTISILNEQYIFDTLSHTQNGADISPDELKEVNEFLNEYGGYFYNGNKLSMQEYNDKLKNHGLQNEDNDFKVLEGTKLISVLKKELQNK